MFDYSLLTEQCLPLKLCEIFLLHRADFSVTKIGINLEYGDNKLCLCFHMNAD